MLKGFHHFGENYNFGGLPEDLSDYKTAKVVVIPAPYEGTVTWGSGAARGPEAIISASRHMELFDEELLREFCDIGIATLPPVEIDSSSPEGTIARIETLTKKVLADGKFPLILGGEHSITLGPVKAVRSKFKKLSVLQIDAHADLRPEYTNTKFSHASIMARVRELVPAVQVGIRSFSADEVPAIKKFRKTIFMAQDIVGKRDWIDEVCRHLTDEVYITFDIDGLDSSIMPATGTPEPGGLDYYTTLALLREVGRRKKIVACDLVELAPKAGFDAADFLAAKLAYKMLGYAFYRE